MDDANAAAYVVLGMVLGACLTSPVLETLRTVTFFASQFVSFSADGTYNDANLVGVLRRNSKVETLWMNLGYSESNVVPHYAETAAALAKKLGEAGGLASAGDACDVGFGYGDQDLLWASQYPALKLVGFNIGVEQQRVASRRVEAAGLSKRVDLRVGSGTSLSLEDASVDRVLSLESAFHYDTREDFLKEAFRVLRPGGVLAARLAASVRLSSRVPRPSFERRRATRRSRTSCTSVGPSRPSSGRISGTRSPSSSTSSS